MSLQSATPTHFSSFNNNKCIFDPYSEDYAVFYFILEFD